MAIKLFDSLKREIRELRKPDPANPKDVFSFYNCGPTVYAPAHIGNFRTFVINDVLRRVLELEFGTGKVKHVRNLTDVDDRTIGQTQKEKRPLAEITKKWTDLFHADCAALNCLSPHVEPTATGHIREQVDMIEVLMQKGNAYRAADGSVYFKIASFPEYGALSRIKERELKVTNTVADADHKDSVSDFALWKAYKPEEDGDVRWPGPRTAAEGRPGWHIECSAMIKKHLGETIDLHTGGVDLLFPHHENEIAQSQCCNGTTFARHWYHSEHLLVDGKKMSKSEGTLYTVDDIRAKGFSAMELRYALLMFGHPRHQLNFTMETMHTAREEIIKLRAVRDHWVKLSMLEGQKALNGPPNALEYILDYLRDDLNTTAARSHMIAALTNNPAPASEKLQGLDKILSVLGIDLSKAELPSNEVPKIVLDLGVRLGSATMKGDSDSANQLRAELLKIGWEVINEPGPNMWSLRRTSLIDDLAKKRWAAKHAKDFALADALRKELTAAGWSMLDRKDGYSLEPLKK